jgi:hypothetical protein
VRVFLFKNIITMAKELPYFKFEASAWMSGEIQICDYASKGLYIELCSLYWSRSGELSYAFALQKLCMGNKDALQPLVDCNAVKVNDGQIVVDFLDEQLSDFLDVSAKRKEAAEKRWSKESKTKDIDTIDANALQVHSKSNAIREEKRREDKIREKETIPVFEDFLNYAIENKPNIDQESVKFKYNSWKENNWKTGGATPKQIKNWKSTLLNTLPHMKEAKTETLGFTTNR